MKRNIEKLKEQARGYELSAEWERAIQVYLDVLSRSDGDEETELPLFNRVGDLYLRLGRLDEAVNYYERAAERYADVGLGNTAIALCSKALRYRPNRIALYKRLGQLSAQQGFLTDARKWFLEYAERMQRLGQLDDAFSALAEFANLSGDAEVHELLARRLLAHDRTADGIAALTRAYAIRARQGNAEAAEALKAEILALDPNADLEEAELVGATVDAGSTYSSAGSAAEDGTAGGDSDSTGWEVGDVAADSWSDPESTGPVDADVAIYASAAASELGLETAADSAGLSTPDDTAASGGEEDPLPLIYYPDDDGHEAAGADIATPISGPAEPAVLTEARELVTGGRESEAIQLLTEAHQRLAVDEDWAGALAAVAELIRLSPADLDAARARVEYAARLNSPTELVLALVSLADCLERLGARSKAAVAYARVLEMDPNNEAAREASARLGSLMKRHTGKSGDDGAARFRIAEQPRSGDDARDFAEMLAQFKAKVSEHVGVDDPDSHFDLGLAYREMGLIEEAINEFQIVLRGGEQRLKVYEELGHCYMLVGRHNIAEKILERALQLPHGTETELAGIYYHLGRCQENLGRPDRAKEMYLRAIELDGGLGDAAERVARL